MKIDIHKCTLFQVLITFDSDNDKFPKRYCVVLELIFEGCRNSFMVLKYKECRLITSSAIETIIHAMHTKHNITIKLEKYILSQITQTGTNEKTNKAECCY